MDPSLTSSSSSSAELSVISMDITAPFVGSLDVLARAIVATATSGQDKQDLRRRSHAPRCHSGHAEDTGDIQSKVMLFRGASP
jgi:hypothetical protein